MEKRKVILYISMSLDGYVATKEDDLGFLSAVQQEGEDYGYGTFTSKVDTYILGRKTYEVVKNLLGGDFPQARQFDCYVVTRQNQRVEEGVTFYNGDINELIKEIRSKEGKHIYCDGGPEIVRLFLENNLFDEIIVSVIPVLLGDGKKLFLPADRTIDLELLETKSYSTGLVQLHYKVG